MFTTTMERTKSNVEWRKWYTLEKSMKFCFFVCMVGCIVAWINTDWDKSGPFKMVLNSRIIKCSHDRSLNLDVSGIKIYIFDFSRDFNQSFPIFNAAKGILNIEDLDKTRQFIMFVGGFTSHINHAVEQQMRRAYATYPNSYLIMPDHSQYTNNHIGNIKGYERAVTHVYYIGRALGQMLAQLSAGGVNPKNIHSVGHSLGGQILGHTGVAFAEASGNKIPRITALDPAGPCFTASAIENQVRSGVADYVEVYHCNSGALGSSSILGDVDFIVNKNGEMQPSCATPIVPVLYGSTKSASCNHRICVDLWTASVKKQDLFTAYRCESYQSFRDGKCALTDKTVAGLANPGKVNGVYYLSTAMYDLKAIM